MPTTENVPRTKRFIAATQTPAANAGKYTKPAKAPAANAGLSALKTANVLNAHQLLKLRFAFAITGQFPVATPASVISVDDLCPFGKWLYGPTIPMAERVSDDFERVRKLHARFHKLAGQVKEFIDANDISTSRERLSVELEQTSKELVTALETWADKLQGSTGKFVPFGLDISQAYVPICKEHRQVFPKFVELLDVTQACVPVCEYSSG